jgi:hypothetical protein
MGQPAKELGWLSLSARFENEKAIRLMRMAFSFLS